MDMGKALGSTAWQKKKKKPPDPTDSFFILVQFYYRKNYLFSNARFIMFGHFVFTLKLHMHRHLVFVCC